MKVFAVFESLQVLLRFIIYKLDIKKNFILHKISLFQKSINFQEEDRDTTLNIV